MLYQRDIARMAGEGKDTKGMEDEYKTFLAELGGKDPRDLGSSGRSLYALCPLILQPAAHASILTMPVKRVIGMTGAAHIYVCCCRIRLVYHNVCITCHIRWILSACFEGSIVI